MNENNEHVGFEQFAQHIAKRQGSRIEDARQFIRHFEDAVDYFCHQKNRPIRLNLGTFTKVKRFNSSVEQITFRQRRTDMRKVRITPSVFPQSNQDYI